MKMLPSGYDVPAVREMMSSAEGRPLSDNDIYNMSRPRQMLSNAQRRQGFYAKGPTLTVVRRVLLRRLARELGRTSPRLLPSKGHETNCPTCGDTAVIWEGQTRCEKGHEHELA